MTGARIDAHHHLWDPALVDYGWLAPDDPTLGRAFHPPELEPQLRAAGIDRTVLVQAANSVEDTAYMLDLADAHPWIAGVVGWVPLDDPARTRAALDATPHPRLVGIRHLLGEGDAAWALDAPVLSSLAVLAERGLVLDYPALFPVHLDVLPELAARLPRLRIVLDHLASPRLDPATFDDWAAQLAAAAARPNVVAKLSGLATGAPGASWTAADLRPYVEHALDVFGAERLMFGSDWPVCLLAGSYERIHAALLETLDGRTEAERDAVLGGTAIRVYGLADGAGPSPSAARTDAR